MSAHELPLPGCTPEPLINYLKALGILRIVSEDREHGDPEARGCWRDGVFVLRSKLDEKTLSHFLLNDYSPTPVVVPWSGNDFFAVESIPSGTTFKKTPTGAVIISAFQITDSERLTKYRETIGIALKTLQDAGIGRKEQMKGRAKSLFLSLLRSRVCPEAISWIDAAAVMSEAKAVFNALLGSGGGSDGNTHFSDNFMQNLWDVLPDFDPQRAKARSAGADRKDASRELLAHALFSSPTAHLVIDRTSSLFDSGAVGGPNAGQGFERSAFANPWNFVFALEGVVCFAGALSKRARAAGSSAPVFPFQVLVASTGTDSLAEKEQSGREVWVPMWSRLSRFVEVRSLLSEGRAEIGAKPAASGIDFARATAGLGVDRGIRAFRRYAIVKGRVGGENYNTAASLGEFPVAARRHIDLLREIDPWLSSFRRACGDNAPARFTSALRRIEWSASAHSL